MEPLCRDAVVRNANALLNDANSGVFKTSFILTPASAIYTCFLQVNYTLQNMLVFCKHAIEPLGLTHDLRLDIAE